MSALRAGQQIDRPTEEIRRERDRLAEEYGALLDEETRGPWNDLLALSRTVFPYVEEHKFFCDYWFLTRWWNKLREFGALLAQHGFLEDGEDVFQLSRYEVASALDELALTWATGGVALGPKHWPPIVARRKQLLERLAEWTPPPALGVAPEAVTDPMTIMLWGVTTERVREWARQVDGGRELNGAAASPGVVEGPARVVRSVSEIADVRDGEILVCGSTSPAWAPIFSKIRATVTDVGGVMSHAAIVCREYGLPAVVGTGRATSQIHTGQMIRVDGTAGVVTLLDGDGGAMTARRLHPAARGPEAGRRARVRRQEQRARASCWRPASRCRRGSRSQPRRSRRSWPSRSWRRSPSGRWDGSTWRTWTRSARRRGRSSRRCARAGAADGRALEVQDRYGGARRARGGGGRRAGGGALERRRRGQRAGDVRRPAGHLPVGARSRGGVRRGPRLLGQPLQRAGDLLPRRLGDGARAGDGGHGPG